MAAVAVAAGDTLADGTPAGGTRVACTLADDRPVDGTRAACTLAGDRPVDGTLADDKLAGDTQAVLQPPAAAAEKVDALADGKPAAARQRAVYIQAACTRADDRPADGTPADDKRVGDTRAVLQPLEVADEMVVAPAATDETAAARAGAR